MAINDDWTYTRRTGQLEYTVYAVKRWSGEAKARAAFPFRVIAEAYAEGESNTQAAGPDWCYAVEDSRGRVTWTDF